MKTRRVKWQAFLLKAGAVEQERETLAQGTGAEVVRSKEQALRVDSGGEYAVSLRRCGRAVVRLAS